jgi:hypothetical protein
MALAAHADELCE